MECVGDALESNRLGDNVLLQPLSVCWAGVTGPSGSEVQLCGWIGQPEGRFFHSLLLCSHISDELFLS